MWDARELAFVDQDSKYGRCELNFTLVFLSILRRRRIRTQKIVGHSPHDSFGTLAQTNDMPAQLNDEDFRQAMASLQAGRLNDAEGYFKKVLRHQPEHVAALNLLGI